MLSISRFAHACAPLGLAGFAVSLTFVSLSVPSAATEKGRALGPESPASWKTSVRVAPPIAAMASAASRPVSHAPLTTGTLLPAHLSAPHPEGLASFYWQPQKTASGEQFDRGALTAAHRTLPFNTRVRVTHVTSGRSVVVRINDRGPFKPGRIIDLSDAAADIIGMKAQGLARVRLEVLP
jgi:rare lipoprotein A